MVSIKLHSAVGSGCNTKTFDSHYGNGWNPKNSEKPFYSTSISLRIGIQRSDGSRSMLNVQVPVPCIFFL